MVNWFLLGVALCASVAGPAEVHGQSVRATVISIGNGDTIRVRASRRGSGVWQLPGGITRPWDFRRGVPSATVMARPARACADRQDAAPLLWTA
jgi:hypothetical protein